MTTILAYGSFAMAGWGLWCALVMIWGLATNRDHVRERLIANDPKGLWWGFFGGIGALLLSAVLAFWLGQWLIGSGAV